MSQTPKKIHKPRLTHRQRVLAAAKAAVKIQTPVRLHRTRQATSGGLGSFEHGAEVGKEKFCGGLLTGVVWVGEGIPRPRNEVDERDRRREVLKSQGWDGEVVGCEGRGGDGDGRGGNRVRLDSNKLKESPSGKTIDMSDGCGVGDGKVRSLLQQVLPNHSAPLWFPRTNLRSVGQVDEPNIFVKEVTVVRFEDDGSRSRIKYEFLS
ncbi:hypothetical protein L873DRAFT_1791294 [Choiromyces venosus 120613-1]|uniref:Uncharacterized protein n=1 Tax=Choiromyces venosus 120613-1 TaxID=1336337 RepID=A0A3N4JTD8_9PEZI|nr:hypothetical protein L873DRAFT_1791294 [Choiromyces venosus 120613-1]